MKYLLTLLFVLLVTPALAEKCAGGNGDIIIGLDGTRYCRSTITMDWKSAFAWCRKFGGELIDELTECPKSTGTVACPNLKTNSGEYSWTRNVPVGPTSKDHAYCVDTSSGTMYANVTSRNVPCAALCIEF